MEYPQFRLEAADCHIEGAMQDPAEPPSAADAEPPVAPDAEPRDSQNSHRKLQKLQKLQKLRRIPSGMIGEISQRKLRKLRLDRHHQNMLSQQNLFMQMPTGMIGMIGMKRSRFRKLSHHNLQTSTSGTKVNIQRITGATTPRPQEQQLTPKQTTKVCPDEGSRKETLNNKRKRYDRRITVFGNQWLTRSLRILVYHSSARVINMKCQWSNGRRP